MSITIKAALGLFLLFIWILCRACTLADEREGFWDIYFPL